jgi:hypothetical protein
MYVEHHVIRTRGEPVAIQAEQLVANDHLHVPAAAGIVDSIAIGDRNVEPNLASQGDDARAFCSVQVHKIVG